MGGKSGSASECYNNDKRASRESAWLYNDKRASRESAWLYNDKRASRESAWSSVIDTPTPFYTIRNSY